MSRQTVEQILSRIDTIHLQILTPRSLLGASEHVDAIRHFCKTLPELMPDHWGYCEPYDKPFSVDRLSDVVPKDGVCDTTIWERNQPPFSWGRCAPKRKINIGDTHGNVSIKVGLGTIDQQRLVDYLRQGSVHLRADLALADSYDDRYADFGRINLAALYGNYYVVTHDLRKWLPDVFWATVFGPAYVKLLGLDRLLSAPAYKVERIGVEMVYVQLTEKLADTHEQFDKVQAARERFKAHFKSANAFFDPTLPEDHRYNVPTFQLLD